MTADLKIITKGILVNELNYETSLAYYTIGNQFLYNYWYYILYRTEIQQIGIIPDIKIEPTIKGISEGKDGLLDKAIDLIKVEIK